jgi:hypothetical protein
MFGEAYDFDIWLGWVGLGSRRIGRANEALDTIVHMWARTLVGLGDPVCGVDRDN